MHAPFASLKRTAEPLDVICQMDAFLARLVADPALGRVFDREAACLLLRRLSLSLPADESDARLTDFRIRQFHKQTLQDFNLDRASGLQYIDLLMGALEDCGVGAARRMLVRAQLLAVLPSGPKLNDEPHRPTFATAQARYSFSAAALKFAAL